MRYLILILIFPVTVQAQSFGVGHSVKFWGQSENISQMSLSYKDFSFYHFNTSDDTQYERTTDNKIVYIGQYTTSIAMSWTPLKYKVLTSGVMLSSRKFPVETGSRLNFVVGIEIPIKKITISYKHISNGFGIINPINIGADFLSISFNLY